MTTYQFQCCKEVNGEIVPVEDVTPTVTANTPTEAMNHPDLVAWFKERPDYRIYKAVK